MDDARGQSGYRGVVVAELPGYRIERELGRGSMGVVYLAEDVQLRRKVALKILASTLADDELFRKRFDRESQSAANLDHPHIVPVYAAGEAGGSLYIAMRYVPGGDLRALLDANGPLSLQQATSIVASVADALDAAHAQGMIHRDVKPANILIDSRNGQEHYYLSDFGITKIVSAGRSLTSTGQIVGTIDYIAPEQIQGRPVDSRTDLYALGCVLYQCLTGDVPFPRDETAALMWAHVHDEASPVITRRPDLPPQIDHIVAKAIAKRPEDRYDTCRELAVALRDLAGNPAGSAGSVLPARPVEALPSPPPAPSSMTGTYVPPAPARVRAPVASSPSREWRWWWFAAGVLILALIAGSTVGVMRYFSSQFPNAAEQELLGQIPLALTMKNSCTRNTEAEQDAANVLASVTCTSDGNATNKVVFTKFASAEALDSHYQATVTTAGVGHSAGSCLNAERAEGVYTGESGQTSGRTVCYQQRGSSFVTWTDDRVHLLAKATRIDPDYMKLRDWWAGVVGLPASPETEAQAKARQEVEAAKRQAEETRKQAEEAQKQQAEDAKKQAEEFQRQLDEAKKQAEAIQKQQAEDVKKQAEESQRQIEEARKQAEAAQKQQAEDAKKQAEEFQRRLDEAKKQAEDAQRQTQGNGKNGENQNPEKLGLGSGIQDLDNGNSGGSSNAGQGDGSGKVGSQDLQRQIDAAVQRALKKQGKISQQQNSAQQNSAQQNSAQQNSARVKDLQKQIEVYVGQSIPQQGNAGSKNLQKLIDEAIKQAIHQAQQGSR